MGAVHSVIRRRRFRAREFREYNMLMRQKSSASSRARRRRSSAEHFLKLIGTVLPSDTETEALQNDDSTLAYDEVDP